MYEVKMQKLDTLVEQNNRIITAIIDNKKVQLDKVKDAYILKNPLTIIDGCKKNYDVLLSTLKALNPLGILEKGYSVVKKDNEIIKDIKKLKKDDELNIKFMKGEIKATVKEIIK